MPTDGSPAKATTGPLAGVRVLELGSFIAGPFAGQLLGDYGAEVIKVEAPGSGDPMRRWGITREGQSLWWPTIARNKRSVTVDLRQSAGRSIVGRLMARSDIVIENFRPGRLAEWGLGYDRVAVDHPGLILVHVSGFGQTGPRASDAGFGSIGEAMGGIRHTTGSPDRPPSRSGISLGDSLAALFAVTGALAALSERARGGTGQEVDVAIYESVFALMESSLADHALGGVTRGRTGSVLPGVAPSNVYPTADGADLVIAANADSVFARLCEAMEEPGLTEERRFADHGARGENMADLDHRIARWTIRLRADEALAVLELHGVPAGRIFTAPDMLNDPHFAAREMVVRCLSRQGIEVPMSGVVPKFSRTPGLVLEPGPSLGEHTETVLREVAGVDDDEWRSLVDGAVV
jgi:formyl-CoA transferase/succinyl-CoA--D-citramalate CoA-transferase